MHTSTTSPAVTASRTKSSLSAPTAAREAKAPMLTFTVGTSRNPARVRRMRRRIEVHPVRRGFTAVEMLAALFLAGLLGALATVWLSGPRESADLDAVAKRIATCDRLA